ncbi:MAG: VWA domain-containing protein [Verrucomicrobiota bacterium]
MTEFSFLNPAWLWGILVVPMLVLLRSWGHWEMMRRRPALVAPRLAPRLIRGGSQTIRWMVTLFLAIGFSGLFVSLARPVLGFEEIETESEARNLILAIDTSRSMLATDLQPNRISRAKLAAQDIVRSLPDDRIGILAFAGSSFLQAPLTIDHEAVIEALAQLDTEIIPRGGTNLTAAVELAIDSFEEAEIGNGALVIFSDGEALEGQDQVERIRKNAQDTGLTIITVGVGTASGSIIPLLDQRGAPIPGKFVENENGEVVRSRLEDSALQALASEASAYIHLGGRVSLTQVVSEIQSRLETTREEAEARLRPIERFPWPLSFGLVALLFAYLLPTLVGRFSQASSASSSASPAPMALGLLTLSLVVSPLRAEVSEEQAYDWFSQGNYRQAAKAFESLVGEDFSEKAKAEWQLGLGASAYRLGDFEKATEAYGAALLADRKSFRASAHYNLGNTLFRRGEASLDRGPNPDSLQALQGTGEEVDQVIGQWENAIEHFEAALELPVSETIHRQAEHNIEVIKRRIEDLRNQQEQEQQERDEQEQEENQEQEQNQEQEEDGDEGEDSADPEEGEEEQESEDGETDNESDESSQGESDTEQDENQTDPQDEENPESGEEDREGDSSEEQDSDQGDNSETDPTDQDDQQLGDSPDRPEPSEADDESSADAGDGDLEANPEGQSPQAGTPQSTPMPEEQVNPETGYSPSEARDHLNDYADETVVRPLLPPAGRERFKDW